MRILEDNGESGIVSQIHFSKQAIISTDFSVEIFFTNQFPKSKNLQKMIFEAEEDFPQARELVYDVYAALSHYAPHMRKENEMIPKYLINFAVIKQLLEHETYLELRNVVEGDDLLCLISTEVLFPICLQIAKKLNEKFEELLKEYNEFLEAMQKAAEENEEPPLTAAELQEKFEKVLEELEAAYAESTQSFEFTKKISVVLNKIKSSKNAEISWGLGNDGTFQKMAYSKKIDVIEKLKSDEKIKKVALLAGKLRALLTFGKDTITTTRKSMVTGITKGDDISLVMSSEITKFLNPATRNLFLQDFSDKKLQQYELGSKVKKGEGHIISLIDVSGSMMGDSEIWSKAVALALLDIARKKRRSYVAIHFDSGVKAKGLHANYFTKSQPYNIEQVIDMAEFFSGGGTEFQPPLDRARTEISSETEFTKADIIMITDGQSFVSDAWLEDFLKWKKEKKINVFSILIGSSSGVETLKKFSDTVVNLDSINEEGFNVAEMLFNQLI